MTLGMPINRQVGAVLVKPRALRIGNSGLRLEHLNLTSNAVRAVRSIVRSLFQSIVIRHYKYLSTEESVVAYQPG